MDEIQQTLTGQTLKGYELKELIGSGGFGSVYRAWYPLLRREVAIKIILPEYTNQENFIRRFEAEAQVIARLDHLHIVPLYDFWREPDSACLVMRWLRGGSLEAAIDNHGSWPLEDAARLVDQIASALATAHRNGIVHRDLKPANILLDDEKNAYLADFGIAKDILVDQDVTEDDRFGSPEYISPEQVMGQPVSAQTDIYSLGVVLYMMLTGRTPFSGSTTTAVIRRHLNDTLPPLQSTHPDLPHGLNAVIWRATAKRPEQRYPDSLAMAADVRRVIGGQTTVGTMTTRVGMGPQVIVSPVGKTIPIDIPLEPENPYKGLRAFQEADQADFYGRKKLVELLLSRLSDEGHLSRFLAVVGPSGSGKSSVVKAGLLPAIRRGTLHGSDGWFITQMTPGAAPFQELGAALLKMAKSSMDNLVATLQESPEALLKVAQTIAPDGLLLVIDQFEELFTLTPSDEERVNFLKSLAHAVISSDSRLHIVIMLRADYYDRPLLYPEFGELVRERTVVVLPLSSAETEEAIIGPAERYGLRFESGLVSAIVSDVGYVPGSLPLLQYALTELFEKRNGYVLTHAGYEASGGVLRSLGSRAEAIYQSFDLAHQQMSRRVFLQLIATQDNRDDTRKRILRSRLMELAGNEQDVLDSVLARFASNRLLSLDYEPLTRAPVVEVAHEALFRVWDRLKEWIDAAQTELRLYEQLEVVAHDWEQAHRDPTFLARGGRLAQFTEWASAPVLPLSEIQRSYVNASEAARQQARRRVFLGIVGLGIVAMVAIGLAFFAFDRQNTAERERELAARQLLLSQARELSTNALIQLDIQPDLSLLLSLASLNAADTTEGRNSLLTALQAHPRLERFFQSYSSPINTLDQSPDDQLLITGHEDGRLVFWNMATGHPVGDPLAAHRGAIQTVRFSMDGFQVASAGNDQELLIWSVETRTLLIELRGHTNTIRGLDYSPNGRWLASADDDGTIMIWDAGTHELIDRVSVAGDVILSAIAFSPDSQFLAASGNDGLVRVWDSSSWTLVGNPLEGHTNWVRDVKFLPGEGDPIVASGSSDGRIVFWDAATGTSLGDVVTSHVSNQGVWHLAFSPDGSQMVTVSQDHTVEYWEVATGLPLDAPFVAHTDAVRDAVFALDAGSVWTAGRDSRLLQWTLVTPNILATPLPFGLVDIDNPPAILSVAFSPDGQLVAASGGESRASGGGYGITVWNTATGRVVQTLLGHQQDVLDLQFTQDGTKLVSSSSDQRIYVWNVLTGEIVQTFSLGTFRALLSLAISPDDRVLAAGTADGKLHLWNLSTGISLNEALTGVTDAVTALAFSPDGRLLATASVDGVILLWDATSWKLVHVIDAISTEYSALIFSPDGQTLISGDRSGHVRFWDVLTGVLTGNDLALTDEVTSVSISGDGAILLTATYGNNIQLWDVATLRPLGGPLVGHSDLATAAAINLDGTQVITGGVDRQILLWSIGVEAWKQLGCRLANRDITSQEVVRYGILAAYAPDCQPHNP